MFGDPRSASSPTAIKAPCAGKNPKTTSIFIARSIAAPSKFPNPSAVAPLAPHRPRLSLVVTDVETHGVLGILREVDSSFKPAAQ